MYPQKFNILPNNTVVSNITTFIVMWIFGTGLFYYFINEFVKNAEISATLSVKLYISCVPGLIWTIIGFYLSNKDEKIENGKSEIIYVINELLEKNKIKI